jgi:dihydrodipicolinate synthase/N-acetylneuraminate lyase
LLCAVDAVGTVAVVVAGVSNETAAEATGLAATTTCSRVDNRLLNRPCVVDLPVPDVVELEVLFVSVSASLCTPFLWP